jgi:DinB superfamily
MYKVAMTTDLRYPVGPFTPAPDTPAATDAALRDIEALPATLRAAIAGLNDRQLDTPYRPGGWTVRQVVHHVADSHMNGLIRTKLALTEANPTIKPYDEAAWALLADASLPIDVSLPLIEGVHTRWVRVLRALAPDQRQRTFVHPEHGQTMTIGYQVQDYGWHSRHHVAHITALRQREGW